MKIETHVIPGLCEADIVIHPTYFDPTQTQTYDVISTSLFKMKNGYKNFEKYMRGLRLAITQFNKRLRGFYFMLWIDDSIYTDPEIYDQIKQLDNGRLFIMRYKCPIGIDPTYPAHLDLFGSIVRMMPYFNYEANFTRNVICIDADIDSGDLDILLKIYPYFADTKIQFLYDTNPFYDVFARHAVVGADKYNVVAGRQMCKYKFELGLLIDFLTCVKAKDCSYMEHFNNRIAYQQYTTYPYGVDEYFINVILMPYMQQKHIVYAISIRYNISAPLWYWESSSIVSEPSHELERFIESKMRWILGYGPDKHRDWDWRKLITKFDQLLIPLTYSFDENTKVEEYQRDVAQRYMQFIIQMRNDHNYTMFKPHTLDRIIANSHYIHKHNIVVYQRNGTITKYLFPDYLKYD